MAVETNEHRVAGRGEVGRPRFRLRTTLSIVAVILVATTAGAQKRGAARSASLRVTGAVAGSIIAIDDVRYGRTDASGARTFANIPPGRRIVLVRQAGFVDDRRTLVFAAGGTAAIKPKRIKLSDDAERLRQSADFLAADGKHTEAAVEFRRAIAARSNGYRDAEIGLVRSLLALKDYDGSATAAEAVASANPKSLEAQTVLANVLRDRGLYDEAAETYRRAIALSPRKAPEAHAGLAILLSERGDLAGAATEYASAISQNLDAEPILYQLYGSVLERLERRTEALAAYERFLVLAPTSPLATAVQSVVDQLKQSDDENPYAPNP